ncbi:hypothetical protein [Candidatus Sororendozoicomonas aggregata]|uniref:hypothetical protein n=1 Tax=Candidatus Sororendozoicomonas aggregata TaxID=3073239 RepID=UPI002ED6B3BC
MRNADNTPDSFKRNEVFAVEDFTDRQLENLRRRLPPLSPANRANPHFHWRTFGMTAGNFLYSGWKLHIPGEHIAHSVYLYENLEFVVIKWRALAKVGGELSDSGITGYAIPPNQEQFGKSGAAICVPPSVFSGGYLQSFVDDILTATNDYHCEVQPLCTKHLCGNLYYRYDLSRKFDIKTGIPWNLYEAFYIGKHPNGSYKPSDVNDPFLTLILLC